MRLLCEKGLNSRHRCFKAANDVDNRNLATNSGTVTLRRKQNVREGWETKIITAAASIPHS
jgi:hypothetical protein